MSPKLPIAKRAEIANIVQRRRALTRMIRRLEHEKRCLPTNAALARTLGVGYKVVLRAVRGEPYQLAHPYDR